MTLDRRTFLRGAGASVALPYLEAMMPRTAFSFNAPHPTPRMGMFYFGTGMNTREFFPEDFGPDYTTTRILEPLEKLRGDFTVLSNTWLEYGGGHKGAYPFSTSIVQGGQQQISPDQIAAKVVAYHGWDDPMAEPDSVLALAREMTDARADWQLLAYGHTAHAFTTPGANNPEMGTVYSPDADRRSWAALRDFLGEVLG